MNNETLTAKKLLSKISPILTAQHSFYNMKNLVDLTKEDSFFFLKIFFINNQVAISKVELYNNNFSSNDNSKFIMNFSTVTPKTALKEINNQIFFDNKPISDFKELPFFAKFLNPNISTYYFGYKTFLDKISPYIIKNKINSF
jgi:hypothetical protein